MNYKKLIKNPLFFRWVFYPDEKLEMYWESYLNHHPESKKQILDFKNNFEKYLKPDNLSLTDLEKKKLAQQIVNKIEHVNKAERRVVRLSPVLRYAAIAIFFFTVGSALVYLYMDSKQPIFFAADTTLPSTRVQEPVLITNENRTIQLDKESELDYSCDSGIVIDKRNIINKKAEGKIPELNTVVIPYGNRSNITLSDGSKVWLNAGSRLIYPSEFVDKYREVFLTGEAFFDIEKNPGQPFIVRTPDVLVEVTGTRFNISAYPEDYSVQTVLEEGKVSVKKAEGNILVKTVDLLPGQMAYFNKKSKKTNIYNVNLESYTLWTEGLFSFSNTDFNRITKKLERYYNIRFQYDDTMKGMVQITGKLDVTKGKEEVIEYLAVLTGFEFIKLNEYLYEIK